MVQVHIYSIWVSGASRDSEDPGLGLVGTLDDGVNYAIR